MSSVSTKELIHAYVQLPGVLRENFKELRSQAKENLDTCAFPTKKDEEWRFTDLKSITSNKFESVDTGIAQADLELDEYHLPEAMSSRLVFIDGNFSPSHSAIEGMPDGVIVGNINDFPEHEQLRSHLGTMTNYEDDVFVPLNDVNFQDGTFIFVPKETVIEQPIHILNVFTHRNNPHFVTPRVLFVGEMYSKATIIEEHIGLSDNVYLNVPVNEFRVYIFTILGSHLS